MSAFELDMAFAPAEVAAGLRRLFGKLGLAWSCKPAAPSHYEFNLTLPAGHSVVVALRPLPQERSTSAPLWPRTLLEARSAEASDLDPLRRSIVLAFLRTAG